MDKIIDALIASFAGIFGTKFTSQLADQKMENAFRREWSLGLEGLTEQQVYHAISKVRLSRKEWPPSIGEFVSLALNIPDIGRVCGLDDSEFSRDLRNQFGGKATLGQLSLSRIYSLISNSYENFAIEWIECKKNHALENNPSALRESEEFKNLLGDKKTPHNVRRDSLKI